MGEGGDMIMLYSQKLKIENCNKEQHNHLLRLRVRGFLLIRNVEIVQQQTQFLSAERSISKT
jgi:hypothetical protein